MKTACHEKTNILFNSTKEDIGVCRASQRLAARFTTACGPRHEKSKATHTIVK